MKEKKETDLGKDKLGMLLLKLALPAILAQIINVLYNMVDRMYIGHIPKAGPDALTGVGVTMPVIMAISAFAALVSMGGAPRASIMMGRKDHKQAEKILGNCTMMLIIMAVILTGVFLIWGGNILLIFGASEKTIGYALDYMKIYAMGTIFVQLALGLNAFINAQGFAKMGMLTVAIGAIINIILDFLFVKYLKWGVAGAGYATLIAQAISAIMIIYVLMKSEEAHQLIIKDIRFDVIRGENGLDLFTKVSVNYQNGIGTATCGLGVKSEGRLLVAGTRGYLIAEAPWWKTSYFEVHYENPLEVEKYSERFLGDGLRYEISDFLSMVNGRNSSEFKLTRSESVALADMMEQFLKAEKRERERSYENMGT